MIYKYKWDGELKKRHVPESFKQWDEVQQIQFLTDAEKAEEDRGFWAKTGSATLDALATLERPAQALKVGIREAGIGGYDPTPEGFWSGAKKGFFGEDEVRTQEFLPKTWNPIVKGILGFVGDVATDPLMYLPVVGTAKLMGKGAQAIPGVAKAASGIVKGAQAVGKVPAVQAFGRRFNVATTDEQRYLRHLERQRKEGSGTLFTDVVDDATGEVTRVNHFATMGSPHFIEQWFRRSTKVMDKQAKKIRGKGEDIWGRKVSSKETLEGAQERVYDALMRYVETPKIRLDEKTKAILGEKGITLGDDLIEQGKAVLKFDQNAGILTPDLQRQLELLEIPDNIIAQHRNFVDVIRAAKTKPQRKIAIEEYEKWKIANLNPSWTVAMDRAANEYIYHYLTPAGRDALRGTVDDIGAAGIDRSKHRTHPYSTAEANLEQLSRYDYQNMFVSNPVLAQALRMTEQHHNIQKKFMIDSISGDLAAKYGVPQVPVGNWVRRIDGDDEVALYVNKNSLDAGPGDILGQGTKIWVGKHSYAGHRGDNVPISLERINEMLGSKRIPQEYKDYLKKIKGYLTEAEMGSDALGKDLSGWTAKLKTALAGRTDDIHEVSKFNEQWLEHIGKIDTGSEGIFTGKYANAVAMGERTTEELERVIPADKLRYAKEGDPLTDDVLMYEDAIPSTFKAPKEVARTIDEYLAYSRNDRELNRVKRLYDGVQNSWKGWTLAIRPAYHMRNLMGNISNAYLISGVKNPKDYTDAMNMQWNGWFRQPTHLENRQAWLDAGGDASKIASDEKWSKLGFSGMADESMESIYYSGNDLGVAGGQYTKDIYVPDVERLENVASRSRFGVEPGRKLQSTIGADSPVIRAGFKAGASLENNARWAVYINALKKIRKNPNKYKWTAPDGKKYSFTDDAGVRAMDEWGITVKEARYGRAAEEVKKSLFDYLDLSKFERNVMKRAVPFYTWMRKNIPAQLEAAVKSPTRMAKINIAREQFEFAGGRPEYKDIAPFWGNRVPIFFGQETDKVRQLFTLLNTLPTADLERFTHPNDLLTEMVSPIPKVFLEQLSNYDTFRKKPIRESGDFLDILKWDGQMKDFLGVEIPANLWHIAQVLVPLAEINRLNPGDIFGTRKEDDFGMQKITPSIFGVSRESNPIDIDTTARWIRFFSGIRSYDINIDRSRYFKAKSIEKDLRSLRTKLKYAHRKGEKRKAQEYIDLIDEIFEQKMEEAKKPSFKSLPFQQRQARQLGTYQ